MLRTSSFSPSSALTTDLQSYVPGSTAVIPTSRFGYEPQMILSVGMAKKPTSIVPPDSAYRRARYLDIIGDKWTPIVLYCLSTGIRRFGELQRRIPDISKKMLIQVLRQLEADGLVNRKVYQQVPPKTEYKLTSAGQRIHEPIAAMCEWAKKNGDVIAAVVAKRNKKND
jgi:DNA-binding HxlR family transcriptional regulator